MNQLQLVALIGFVFFFNGTATTEIYTLSLHDALPICLRRQPAAAPARPGARDRARALRVRRPDRKSTRLNSSHSSISYAVFCLKKKRGQSAIGFAESQLGLLSIRQSFRGNRGRLRRAR